MAKLGDAVQIALGVPDVSASKGFYQRLGFQALGEGGAPWPWAQLTDGQNLVLLNQDGNRYSGLLYLSTDAPALVTELEGQGISFVAQQEQEGYLRQAIFTDPDGMPVGLLHQDASAVSRPGGQPVSKLGKFGELSHRVRDFEAARQFWSSLGFETLHVSDQPYPWGILSDGLVILGLHQRTPEAEAAGENFEFSGPTLTYFDGAMKDHIAALKAEGFTFSQEMPDPDGTVGNAILATPEGGHIFLFAGEI